MYDWLTFTYDENNTYNDYAELPEFIRELKARGIHFVQSVVCVGEISSFCLSFN